MQMGDASDPRPTCAHLRESLGPIPLPGPHLPTSSTQGRDPNIDQHLGCALQSDGSGSTARDRMLRRAGGLGLGPGGRVIQAMKHLPGFAANSSTPFPPLPSKGSRPLCSPGSQQPTSEVSRFGSFFLRAEKEGKARRARVCSPIKNQKQSWSRDGRCQERPLPRPPPSAPIAGPGLGSERQGPQLCVHEFASLQDCVHRQHQGDVKGNLCQQQYWQPSPALPPQGAALRHRLGAGPRHQHRLPPALCAPASSSVGPCGRFRTPCFQGACLPRSQRLQNRLLGRKPGVGWGGRPTVKLGQRFPGGAGKTPHDFNQGRTPLNPRQTRPAVCATPAPLPPGAHLKMRSSFPALWSRSNHSGGLWAVHAPSSHRVQLRLTKSSPGSLPLLGCCS